MSSKIAKVPVVFIIGAGYSGSTLLNFLLDSHSAVVGVGEISRYLRRREAGEADTCGALISECTYWQDVFRDTDIYVPLLYQQKANFLSGRNLYHYYDAEAGRERPVDVQRYAHAAVQAYQRVCALSGKSIVVDSSKVPERAELIARNAPGVEARFIHLVRDGRGFVNSSIGHGRSSYLSIWEWLVVNLTCSIIRWRNPKASSMRVQYQSLASNPERELKRICAWLGITYEPAMLDYTKQVHHQIGGNPGRFNPSPDIKPDMRWKTQLSWPERLLFGCVAGWLNVWYRVTYEAGNIIK